MVKIYLGGLEYEISESGEINKRRGAGLLKQHPDKDGYLKVVIPADGKSHNYLVHRLVYEAFIGPIPPGLTVDHIDDDKTNNHYTNLQLLTAIQNAVKGNAKNWVALSPEGIVVEIYNLKRFCIDNDLHHGHMVAVLNGRPKYITHKGWRKYHVA